MDESSPLQSNDDSTEPSLMIGIDDSIDMFSLMVVKSMIGSAAANSISHYQTKNSSK